MKILLVFLVLMAGPIGCATLETVANSPLREGIVQKFSAKYDAVNGATIAGLASLNVDVKSSQERSEGLIILVSKRQTFTSWGEVGRIFIEKTNGDQTNVYVRWEKRSTGQITGTDAEEFSTALFKLINNSLQKK